ncbi:MAG: class I fructose-bisphosphate aldolase [Gammaproteobacteria bacterium]
MSTQDLQTTANAMVAAGKGILAIDESFPTIKKRFDGISIESTEKTRRAYRELLITSPGSSEFISGMILFDETIRQTTTQGTPFPQVLIKEGILPGIKVDKGAKALAGHPGEKVTEGLDGLRERLTEYRQLGARFAKWRAVITIGEAIPSLSCLKANAHALARYAALCQEEELVPIVEPEVLMDGDNSIERCDEVTEATLRCLFNALYDQRVELEGLVLKTNMVIAGKKCQKQASVAQVAEQTTRCLRNAVPTAIAGVVFLSGGQSAELATAHLNAMNAMSVTHPWPLSFSYGRALQALALKIWSGNADNVDEAQKALFHREKCNGLATLGRYTEALEKELAA